MQGWVVDGLYSFANGALRVGQQCLWLGPRPRAAARVGIYRIGNIGDIVCALPAMAAIRRTYPAARLTLVTSPGCRGSVGARELLREAPWINATCVYYTEDVNTVAGRWALVRRLRRMAFDVWIELPNDLASFCVLWRNLLMARLIGARWAYGWRLNTIYWAARAQAERRAFPSETRRLLAILAEIGIEGDPAEFSLPMGAQRRQVVEQLFAQTGWGGSSLVAIAPAARRSPNRWPAERFAEVGRYVSEQGYRVVVLGGVQDAELCQRVADGIGPGSLSMAGKLQLLESCELLQRCRLLVCNDSGVQHLAVAVGVPSIALFSCRDFRGKWWPYGPHHTVVQKQVECHACFVEICPFENRCINLIEAQEIMALVSQRLGLRGAHGATV